MDRVRIYDLNGNPITFPAEDAAHASGDRGIMALAVRKDTAAALAGTDGDYTPFIVDANGRLHVKDLTLRSSAGRPNVSIGNSVTGLQDGKAAFFVEARAEDDTQSGGHLVAPLLYSADSGLDNERANDQLTALASAARTGDTSSADLVNRNGRGLIILVDVTAVGGTPGVINAINVQAKIGSNYMTVYAFSGLTINSVSRAAFLIYPGAASAGSWTAAPVQGVPPRNYRLNIDHANETDSITYSVTDVHML